MQRLFVLFRATVLPTHPGELIRPTKAADDNVFNVSEPKAFSDATSALVGDVSGKKVLLPWRFLLRLRNV